MCGLTILDLHPRDKSAMLVAWHKKYLISAIVGSSQRERASLSGMSQEICYHVVASQEYNYQLLDEAK